MACHVRELLEIGPASLKIEGRMKSPAYVYTVARVWRTLLDEERDATPAELRILRDAFSRSGFTDGYFTRTLNQEMLGVRTERDKSATEKSSVFFRDCGRTLPSVQVLREPREPLSYSLPPRERMPFSRSARFLSPSQIPDTDYFREIYLPLHAFDPERANGIVLPAVIFDSETRAVRSALEKAVQRGAKHVLVGNPGHFEILRDLPLTLHGDFRLNLTNSAALATFPDLTDAILSPELNLAQIRDLRGKKTVIVYGRIPLMILEKPVGAKSLRDRRGVVFPIAREGSRDVVYNSVPFYMSDREKDLKEKGISSRHFLFTVETPRQILELIEAFKEKKTPDFPIKRIR